MVYNVSLYKPVGNPYAIKPAVQNKDAASRSIHFTSELNGRPVVQNAYVPTNSEGIVNSLITVLRFQDSYTAQHSKDVQKNALFFAQSLGLSEKECKEISIGAALHDIGKAWIPKKILKSDQELTDNQRAIIEKHAVIGSNVLKLIPTCQGEVAKIVKHHHENWDGSGYSDGLKGEEIPLGARIVSITDAYDAMVSDRPYEKGISKKAAVERLKDGAGTKWDPVLVDRFIKIVPWI